MQKKIIYLLVSLLLLTLLLPLTACEKDFTPEHIYEYTLSVGAEEPIKVLHFSDTHLTLYSDGDSTGTKQHARARSRRFGYTQNSELTYVSSYAEQNGCLIVHTGDLMDFVTDANIEKASAFVRNNDCLYVYGNHETDDADQERMTKLSIIADYNLSSCYAVERKGVMFVGINNSQHKVTKEQIDFLKDIVALNKPIVLFCHVPLYTRDLYDTVMEEEDSAYLMAVPEELMTGYPQKRYLSQKADQDTYDGYEYIKNTPQIKAILAGHLHIDYQTKVGDIPQYVIGLNTFEVLSLI